MRKGTGDSPNNQITANEAENLCAMA